MVPSAPVHRSRAGRDARDSLPHVARPRTPSLGTRRPSSTWTASSDPRPCPVRCCSQEAMSLSLPNDLVRESFMSRVAGSAARPRGRGRPPTPQTQDRGPPIKQIPAKKWKHERLFLLGVAGFLVRVPYRHPLALAAEFQAVSWSNGKGRRSSGYRRALDTTGRQHAPAL
jgi:hypothetical protein